MSLASTQMVKVHRRVETPGLPAATHVVDIHCHCLSGLDDGPGNVAQSLQLCAACVADGVHTIIATPHQLGRYDRSPSAGQIRQAVVELRSALAAEGIPLRVIPGADVRLDDRLIELIATDQVMTLGDGGKYLLLELPHDVPIDPLELFQELRAQGITVILSHPERHDYLSSRLDWILRWLGEGVVLQITAGSLLGQFGHNAERVGWSLLEQGWATVVASDAHDCVARPPLLGAAMREIGRRLGTDVGEMVCVENPRRIVDGCPLLSSGADACRGQGVAAWSGCRPPSSD